MASGSRSAVTAEVVEAAILEALQNDGCIENTLVFAEERGFHHIDDITPRVLSLEATDYVSKSVLTVTKNQATEMLDLWLAHGTPERLLFDALPPADFVNKDELLRVAEERFRVIGYDVRLLQGAFGKAMANKWLKSEKRDKDMFVARADGVGDDPLVPLMLRFRSGEELSEKDIAQLKARRVVETITSKGFRLERGSNFRASRKKLETELTAEHLRDGKWQELEYKKVNFAALGKRLPCGHLHPLLKARADVRSIFLEMGFEEMPTNRFVESAFWNFDTLFQPQQHPARDLHDTFYISDPPEAVSLPEDYVKRVKDVHEVGGYDSIGYRYDWSLKEAKRLLLRTHTTAVTSRVLNELAKEPFRPRKFFSIDRVFRNEDMDATHLCEFHQIEGFVMDRGLGLGDMIGLFTEFFSRIGISNLRFKPAYNPYTEPSMEIFGYHEGLQRTVEVGNSGVFRPEMLRPMGFPDDVTVIAWGLSLERPTMIKYNLRNIRDLVGHAVDLEMIRTNPICRMDHN